MKRCARRPARTVWRLWVRPNVFPADSRVWKHTVLWWPFNTCHGPKFALWIRHSSCDAALYFLCRGTHKHTTHTCHQQRVFACQVWQGAAWKSPHHHSSDVSPHAHTQARSIHQLLRRSQTSNQPEAKGDRWLLKNWHWRMWKLQNAHTKEPYCLCQAAMEFTHQLHVAPRARGVRSYKTWDRVQGTELSAIKRSEHTATWADPEPSGF